MNSGFKITAARALLLVGLFALATLSGCIGGGGSKTVPAASGTGGGPKVPTPTSETLAECVLKNTCIDNSPKRHFHHYWGERQSVNIFYMREMEVQQNAFKGNNEGCRTVGHREFNLETDENDAAGGADQPVNEAPTSGGGPKADVVFAGTNRIEVTLLGATLTGSPASDSFKVYFRYQPANLNFFQPDTTCGIPLELNTPKSIPVGPGGADPPHQFLVSRWRFQVWIATPQGDSGGTLPGFGHGFVGLQMTAFNGGENALDPAHPDLWAGSMTYSLGCAKAENVQRQLVVTTADPDNPANRPPQEPLTDIPFEYGRIVPLLTNKITGELKYSNSAPTGALLQVRFFGADSNAYMTPDEVKEEPGKVSFTINDPEQRKADPPYLAESLWRFQLLPVNPNVDDSGVNVADFAGSYEICWTAHRNPDAVLI